MGAVRQAVGTVVPPVVGMVAAVEGETDMAGSYRHITKPDGSFRGTELIDHLGDAYEALEECYLMIQHLTGGDKTKIFEAWREGYFKKCCPPENDPGTVEEFFKE